MSKIPTPIVSATLAAGSTESPFAYSINLTQKLCFPTCTTSTPVFSPNVTLLGVSLVSAGIYMATIHIEGIISYVPCNGGCCDMKAQPVSANVNIPIASATLPTVSIATGTIANAVIPSGCQPCSRTFVSEFPLSITIA